MEQTEERPEQTESSSAEGQQDGAKRKRRRRRGKRRPDGAPGASPADETSAAADADGDDDEQDDTSDAGQDGDAEGTSDSPARKKKRRRRKKRPTDGTDAPADAPADGSAAPSADEAGNGESREPAQTPRPGRGPQPRPATGQRSAAQPAAREPRGGAAPAAAQPKQERRNGKDRRRDKERREQERQQQMLGRIVKTELLREDATADPFIPKVRPVATSVEAYVQQHKGWQREVLMKLREIIVAAGPDLAEDIKWSQPVYDLNGPVCYVKAFSDHINVGFWRGSELRDNDAVLVGDGMKMRHVTIRSVNDLKRDVIDAFVKQAVKLNREKGDPTL